MRRIAVVATIVAAVLSQAAPAWAASKPKVGFDVSFPQCGNAYPKKPAFGIVGVGGGKAFTHNPCLASQATWAAGAKKAPAFYMNTGNPGTAGLHWNQGGPRACSGASSDAGCAYNYGWSTAADMMAYAESQTAGPATRTWWLDVETANSWSATTSLNVTTLQGSIDFLRSAGVPTVGAYSTPSMWASITGNARLPIPTWVATGSTQAKAKTYCGSGFTGGGVALVQFPSGGFDGDITC
jgi:hypothetical protein